MDFCIYDSRMTCFKEPFGAVTAGTPVRFSIHLPKDFAVRQAQMALCRDGEADQFLPMELERCDMRLNCYTLT